MDNKKSETKLPILGDSGSCIFEIINGEPQFIGLLPKQYKSSKIQIKGEELKRILDKYKL